MPIIITDNIERECKAIISLYKDSDYIQSALLQHYPNLSSKRLKRIIPLASAINHTDTVSEQETITAE